MREKPWVKKFETGEYLREWNGYDPGILGCTIYSESINIGEEKFFKCIGEFNGIGDVSWWIKDKIEKLTPDELQELEFICEYKTYIKNFISSELIKKISDFFGCETFHIYRLGDKNIIDLCNQLNKYYQKIIDDNHGCLNEKTIKFKEKENPFKILSYDEYKLLKFEKIKIKFTGEYIEREVILIGKVICMYSDMWDFEEGYEYDLYVQISDNIKKYIIFNDGLFVIYDNINEIFDKNYHFKISILDIKI